MKTSIHTLHTTHATPWRSLLLAICMVGSVMSLSVSAQTNAYKIRDDLYNIYMKAYNARRTKQGLALADSMYSKATTAGDKKAQCLALTIPFLYYFNGNDMHLFDKAMDRLQKKALETGYVQYYYWCNSYKMKIIGNTDSYLKVIAYLKENQNFAIKHNHIYGIYSTYQNLGLTYLNKGATQQAIKSYEKALSFGQKFLPDQDMAINYRRLAQCYMVEGEHEKMLENVEKGLHITKSKQAYDNLLISKCYALFMLGREKEFLQYYDEAYQSFGKVNSNHTREELEVPLQELRIFKLLIEGKDLEARKMIAGLKQDMERNRIWLAYYERKGDFKNAQEKLRYQMRNTYKGSEMVYADELTAINAQLENLRLENEKRKTDIKKTQLRLTNTQLRLKNSSLELAHTKASEHLSRLDADNYQLSLNQKQLEAQQLRDSLYMMSAKRMAHEQELKAKQKRLATVWGVTLAVLALITAYLYNLKRMSRKLKHSNKRLSNTIGELSVANNKAQQADKMKTMFIQNMSHEIRTPLNAIVGFSQLLAEMGEQLGENEKKDMCETIQNNSELLTTIINDILDITALESGKYVMREEDVCVNKACQQAIDTVYHRKAPGVELKLASEVDDDYTVRADANRLKQVLINLLTNAEKNTDSGCITLGCSLHENPGMITFSVTDTGIGVPQDKQEEIFERFKKLDRYKQGSGLGLNICRTIAEKLGGQVYIDKSYHHGARFLFTIKATRRRAHKQFITPQTP